jgi:hypothetical protein
MGEGFAFESSALPGVEVNTDNTQQDRAGRTQREGRRNDRKTRHREMITQEHSNSSVLYRLLACAEPTGTSLVGRTNDDGE